MFRGRISNPFRLLSVHVLPKQQRPLRSLLHCATSICPLRLFMSQCGRFRAAPPLRHAAEFGATLTHFHISTLSHFHNSTFPHFRWPHDPPPERVGIAISCARAYTPHVSSPIYTPSASSTSPSVVGNYRHALVFRARPPCATQGNLLSYTSARVERPEPPGCGGRSPWKWREAISAAFSYVEHEK